MKNFSFVPALKNAIFTIPTQFKNFDIKIYTPDEIEQFIKLNGLIVLP
jgi:hypothetical protein